MIQTYLIYGLIVCLPIAGYIGFDYGYASAKQDSVEAAKQLTKSSVKEADKTDEKKAKERIVYLDIVRTVETSVDPTKCLDTHPGSDISTRVRDLQSL